jgi:hypothetical protein
MTDRAPSIEETMETVQGHLQSRMRTIVPARIVSFTPRNGTVGAYAAVQPQIKIRTKRRSTLPAQIPAAPVIFPTGGGWEISWPLVAGDTVALIIADREIGRWRLANKPVDPQDARMHDLSDAIVLPGLNTERMTLTVPTGNLTIQRLDGSVKIELSPAKVLIDGPAVEIGAAAAQSVILGDAFAAFFDAHTHPTPAGLSSAPSVPMSTFVPSLLSSKVKVAS